ELEAGYARVRGGEHPADLLADRREDLERPYSPCDQRRHAPQSRLLLGELAGSRLGCGELSAALRIRDRRRQELREVREPVLRFGRPGKRDSRRDDHDAPEAPLYRDRCADRGAIAQLARLRCPGTGRLDQIFDAGGATGVEYRRRQALWVDRGLGGEWKLSGGAVGARCKNRDP